MDDVDDHFHAEMHVSFFPDGALGRAWFNSASDARYSCAISFPPGEARVISYGPN